MMRRFHYSYFVYYTYLMLAYMLFFFILDLMSSYLVGKVLTGPQTLPPLTGGEHLSRGSGMFIPSQVTIRLYRQLSPAYRRAEKDGHAILPFIQFFMRSTCPRSPNYFLLHLIA